LRATLLHTPAKHNTPSGGWGGVALGALRSTEEGNTLREAPPDGLTDRVERAGRLCTDTQRIQQVKLQQQRRSVEDLMYASILHNFVSNLKVDLLPSLDGVVEIGPPPPFLHSPPFLEAVHLPFQV